MIGISRTRNRDPADQAFGGRVMAKNAEREPDAAGLKDRDAIRALNDAKKGG